LKNTNFNWGPGLYILGYHLFLLVALPIFFFYYHLPWQVLTLTLLLLYITGISTTTAYHRFYSHATYKLNPVVEAILLFFATMGAQGSALRWSFDHRHHHAFVDTDKDPYSIKKGFWYAHFLWLFEKPKPIEKQVISDLLKNRMVCFQHKHYGLLMFASNILVTGIIGWCLGSYWMAFLFTWMVRQCLLHHFTWFINSLAHTWGDNSFSDELSAMDNYFISFFTWGEGYHNYHHTFANDYRNGIRWYHYDPTKWLIWSLKKLGLADQLKQNDPFFIEKRLVLSRKKFLLKQIHNSIAESKEVWQNRVSALCDSLLEKIGQIQQIKEQNALSKGQKETLSSLKSQLKKIKSELKIQFHAWNTLSKEIGRLVPFSLQTKTFSVSET